MKLDNPKRKRNHGNDDDQPKDNKKRRIAYFNDHNGKLNEESFTARIPIFYGDHANQLVSALKSSISNDLFALAVFDISGIGKSRYFEEVAKCGQMVYVRFTFRELGSPLVNALDEIKEKISFKRADCDLVSQQMQLYWFKALGLCFEETANKLQNRSTSLKYGEINLQSQSAR